VAVAVLVAALLATSAEAAKQTPTPRTPLADASAFEGDAMWIWYVSHADGGDLARIARRARARRIDTVYIKAADGGATWSQFTPHLIKALQRRGLRVCAWQFVYGASPTAEAAAGAEAVDRGADCLVIDAESAYEGRYAQASTYMTALRKAIGPDYPLGLSSFPYVHYHPAFPYSVFLGPGAAEFNLPQAYWQAIGTSVDTALATTYTYNRVYERPISPVGQLYENPPKAEIKRFRRISATDGFAGVSWWSWQHASRRGFKAASGRRLAPVPGLAATATYPTLENGARGDLVVWAQEHLEGGGYLKTSITGYFGGASTTATKAFQAAAGLPRTGVIDATTWEQLLVLTEPEAVTWTATPDGVSRRRPGAFSEPAPRSARLAPVAREIPPARRR
jgi:hypothetical protein